MAPQSWRHPSSGTRSDPLHRAAPPRAGARGDAAARSGSRPASDHPPGSRRADTRTAEIHDTREPAAPARGDSVHARRGGGGTAPQRAAHTGESRREALSALKNLTDAIADPGAAHADPPPTEVAPQAEVTTTGRVGRIVLSARPTPWNPATCCVS